MKKLLLTICLYISAIIIAQSQNTFDYEPIKHKGEIPEAVYKSYLERVKVPFENQLKDLDKKARRDEVVFYHQNAYYSYQRLNSGFIYFGDTITNYCNEVLSKLLENDTILKNKISVYTVVSPDVNVFMSYDGYMFINLGFLTQIENEAQLAYVMAHEVAHYIKRHSLNGYMHKEKVKREIKPFSPQEFNEYYKKVLVNSKNYEFEADTLGLSIFLKSDYQLSEVTRVMDILLYSYLPFDEVEMDYGFFEIGDLKLPNYMKLIKFGEISAAEDIDDSQNTHPNIARRKKELNLIIKKQKTSGDILFKLTEESFKYIRNLSRFEISRQFLVNAEYDKAIYHNYLLNLEYPNNEYLIQNTSIALSSLMHYLAREKFSEVLGKRKYVEGNMLSITSFARDLKPKDIGALAVLYSYEAMKKFPQNKELNKVFNLTIDSYIKLFEFKKSDFNYDIVSIEDHFNRSSNTNDTNNIDLSNLSKLDKLNFERRGTQKTIDDYYHEIVFGQYLAKEDFLERWEKSFDNAEKKKEEPNPSIYKNVQTKYKYRNDNFSTNKIICVSPRQFDKIYDGPHGFYSKETNVKNLFDELKTASKKQELSVEILDISQINTSDIDKFSDLAILKQWIHERQFHADINPINSNSDRIQEIINKYDTKYLHISGITSYDSRGYLDYFPIFGFPIILFYNSIMMHDRYDTYYYNIIFNLENGIIEYIDIKYSRQKPYKGIIHQVVQRVLNEINETK